MAKKRGKKRSAAEVAQEEPSAVSAAGADGEEGHSEEAGSEEEPSAQDRLEARLAAFGEAFLEGIEGGCRSLRKPKSQAVVREAPASGTAPAPSGDSVGKDEAEASGSRKKRRKKSKAAAAAAGAQPTPAAAPAGARAAPAKVAHPAVAAAGEPPVPRPLTRAAGKPEAPRPANAPKLVAPPSFSSRPSAMSAKDARLFMAGKVSDIRGKAAPKLQAGKKKQKTDSDEEDEEFKKVMKEVQAFVLPNLDKRTQYQHEERRIRALGGTIESRCFMPYNKLKERQKRHAEERKVKLEEEKQLGVSTSVSKHRQTWEIDKLLKDKKNAKKEKKRKQDDHLYDLGLGAYEKKGMAVIPKRHVKLYEKHARKKK